MSGKVKHAAASVTMWGGGGTLGLAITRLMADPTDVEAWGLVVCAILTLVGRVRASGPVRLR